MFDFVLGVDVGMFVILVQVIDVGVEDVKCVWLGKGSLVGLVMYVFQYVVMGDDGYFVIVV